MRLQRAYTAAIGFAFLIVVGFTLVADTVANGVSLETAHKLTHVAVGVWAAVIIAKRLDQHVAFALFNGVFYGTFAVIGWFVPDFLGIDAFNRTDTVLHTLVAGAGLLVGFLGLKK
jgi:hypothetical protein